MTMEPVARPLQPGDPAPDFTLPAADQAGTVTFSEYWTRGPVMLALFRGLYCPFCRRQMVQLGAAADKLRARGVATLGVVATPAERARLYFRFHPARYPLGADPELAAHRAYGLPRGPLTPETRQEIDAAARVWARELGVPVRPGAATEAIERFDGFEPLPSDHADLERHQAQSIGQFLVGRDGIVRWARVEQGAGDFPGEEELLGAARRAA